MKLLIAAPINDQKMYCWEEFRQALHSLQCGWIEILLIDTSLGMEMVDRIKNEGFQCSHIYEDKAMDRVVTARELARSHAVKMKHDYLLMIDADVILTMDGIKRLLNHKKDIISAIVHTIDNLGFPRPTAKIGGNYMSADLMNTGLQKVDRVGFGCLLVKTKVLKKTHIRCERFSDGKLKTGEDYCFCDDCKHLGYDIYVDTNLQVKHLIVGQWDWDKA
jgi:hypothetical protein